MAGSLGVEPRARILLLGLLLPLETLAQSLPTRPSIESELVDDAELLATITKRCGELTASGKLLELTKVLTSVRGKEPPSSCPLTLPARRTARLDGPDLRTLAAKSTLIVGTYHLCDHCSEWHFIGASGVAIAQGGVVATCWHVLAEDPDQRQARLAVADLAGRVWPVLSVLAVDPEADVCILATDAKDMPPLALEPEVRGGTRVGCLSHPDDHFGFYSEGIVARWCVIRDTPVDAAPEQRPKGVPMLEVTLDFAKGSSGAPILDFFGNVVGLAQATQAVLYDDAKDPTGVQMVFKIASPARALAALVRTPH